MLLRSTVPQFAIKVDGKEIPDDAMHEVLESTVESSLHLPDACTIRVHDADFKWLDEKLFQEGKEVEIQAGEGRDPLFTIFQGEITTIELDLAAMGVPTLTVRCLDKAHRLHRGSQRRTFENVKDSDIAKKIATEMSLKADVDETTQVHPWVIQNNESNWDFLSMLAERNGYRFYLEGKDKLCFKKVSDQTPKETELEWGKDLRSFRVRVSSSPQVEEVIVRGWDPSTKKPIVGTARDPKGTPKIEERGDGAQVGNQAFGKSKMVIVDRPVKTQHEAETVAQSILDEIANSFIEADGLCYGHPQLRPGESIKIKNIGKRFSGKFIVTSTTHTYSPAEGFSTQFVISGKQPSTLLSILSSEGTHEDKASPNAGNIVVGIVTDNLDPENLARVKVKYPWLTEDHQSHWARIATPMAGSGRGFHFLPEIDDEVLVAFEHGDVNRPFVIGALWNGVDKPVEGNSKSVGANKVNRRTIKTRIGHTFLLDDTGYAGEMSMTTANGHHFTLNDAGQNITAKTRLGHTIVLDDKAQQIKVVDLSGANSIVISTLDGSMALTCIGNMSLTCLNFSLTAAASVTIAAGASIGIESGGAAEVTVAGAMTTTVGAALSTTVGGAMVTTCSGVITETAGGAMMLTAGAAMGLTSGAATLVTAAVNVTFATPTMLGGPLIPIPA